MAGWLDSALTALSQGVGGSPAVALGAAFAWGVLSIVLSPCHLAAIPLVVGSMDDNSIRSWRKALVASGFFAAGVLATIAAVGGLTALAGRMIGDVGGIATYVVAGVLILFGLHLLGAIAVPGLGRVGSCSTSRTRGPWGGLLLGVIFGAAVGPCTFAFMAPVLGIAFQAGSDRPGFTAILLLAFGLGHAGVIVLAGTSMGLTQRYLNWSADSGAPAVVRRVCGVLVVLGGVWLIYTT